MFKPCILPTVTEMPTTFLCPAQLQRSLALVRRRMSDVNGTLFAEPGSKAAASEAKRAMHQAEADRWASRFAAYKAEGRLPKGWVVTAEKVRAMQVGK